MTERANQLFDPESPPRGEAAAPADRTASGGANRSPGPTETAGAAETEVAGETEGRPGVLSIHGLYDEVEGALAAAFPRTRQLWVRGEIHSISDHRSGHLYLDLVDPEDDHAPSRPRNRGGVPTLHVKCWRTTWAPLRHALGKEGITLAEGMVVELRGSLDVYRAKGEVSLILAEVDVTALLGRMAAQRARLLRTLEAEGLLHRNAALAVCDLPLHVGLVASPGTEGYRDFVGRLTESGFAFRISVVKVKVQGADAPASIARAVRMLGRSGCDVIAMVRGGGARADLAAFDTELVARAVAEAGTPVWTGIGHTGDETVADVVANRVCVTPTECGQAIVARVGQWWMDQVADPAQRLARRVPSFLSNAESRDVQARRRLTAAARHQLRFHQGRLGSHATSVRRAALGRIESRESGLRAHTARLGPLSLGLLGQQDERLRSWRRLLAAYDVDRQLERGYSLTLTADGALIRSSGELEPAQEIVTRFADGTVRSRVEASEMRQEDGRGHSG